MTRFIASFAALGLALTATSALAHGGGSMGGTTSLQLGTVSAWPGTGAGSGKVLPPTDHDGWRDGHDNRGVTETQRTNTEITKLTGEATAIIQRAFNLHQNGTGSPEELARLNKEFQRIGREITTLRREEGTAM